MIPKKQTRIVINGKFLSGGHTAVHKVAEEYTLAFDRMLSRNSEITRSFSFTLALPPNAARRLELEHINTRIVGRHGGVMWEQLYLPSFARSAVLLNFCNLGPAFKRRSVTLIHDVQAYTTPESNSGKFRMLYKTLTPLLCRFNKAILSISDYSAAELAPLLPKGKRAITVHNGCDHVLRVAPEPTILDRLGLKPGNYCIALANPKPHKNIRILLSAFSDERLSRVPLVLFGPGSSEDFADSQISIPSQVRFAGRLDDGELVSLMKGAGVLAFPSLTEGFGLPPLEAMALGCPTVIAPRGALPEVCGDDALRADPYTAGDWVEAISSLITDSELSAKVRAGGLERASRFNWENAAEAVLHHVRGL